MRVKL